MAWYREEMSLESLDTTRRVTAAVFSEQLKGIVFDKILVKPTFPFGEDDDYGYVEIKAIYEGEWERLNAVRPTGLLTTLRDSLWDAGVTEFPVLHLIMKSEWDQHPDSE